MIFKLLLLLLKLLETLVWDLLNTTELIVFNVLYLSTLM